MPGWGERLRYFLYLPFSDRESGAFLGRVLVVPFGKLERTGRRVKWWLCWSLPILGTGGLVWWLAASHQDQLVALARGHVFLIALAGLLSVPIAFVVVPALALVCHRRFPAEVVTRVEHVQVRHEVRAVRASYRVSSVAHQWRLALGFGLVQGIWEFVAVLDLCFWGEVLRQWHLS